MFLVMSGRNLNSDSGLSSWNYREIEPNNIDSLFQKLFRHFLRQNCIIKHNWDNGMVSGFNVKTSCSHFPPKIARILCELIPKLCRLCQKIYDCDRGSCNGWCKCV